MPQALVMAGGRSERMRATGNTTHKALLQVGSLTLIERNVAGLLEHGFDAITVAVNSRETALIQYCRTRLASAVRSAGAAFNVFVEERPLGTIGAAREASDARRGPLLVVNVDNLTDLDLRSLYERHCVLAAYITIATHVEPFLIPFGEVREEASRVTEYREKPVLRLTVSSGTYVLSYDATQLIEPDEPLGADALVQRALARGHDVRSFPHAGRWIDINDTASLGRAREVFAEGPARTA